MSTEVKNPPKAETKPEEKAVVLADNNNAGNAIAKGRQNDSLLTVVDMENDMPDMDNTEALPLDLASEYWSPETPGETKKLVFSHFSTSLVPDKYGPNKGVNGEMVELETAYFYEKKENEIKSIRQASKVLLSSLKSHSIQQGTLLQITFAGKKKLNNGNTGDTWSIFPLKLLPKK